MNSIVVATRNENKVKEIKEILKDMPFEISYLNELDIDAEVVEDGNTFEENAYKKAYEIMKITNLPTLADDSGLEVDALNGEPGVHSARFAGNHGDYRKNNEKLLELIKDIPDEKRGARFVTVIVLLYPDGRKLVARGEIRGYISRAERGGNGFGYDPLFVVPQYNLCFAQLQNNIKNDISHRGKALRELKRLLCSNILGGTSN